MGIHETVPWSIAIGEDIFCRDQDGCRTSRCEFAAQVICADAGFHAYQARRYIGEPRFHLATRPLLPQHDGAARIVAHDVERVLADIDADHGDRGIGCLRHGVLLVFGAPCQLRLRAGQEHGRTIPLVEGSPLSHAREDYDATFATPICWSSVRLSSICQLSVTRPFSAFRRSVAMNSIACPLPCVWPKVPVKWPVNLMCTVTQSPAMIIFSTLTFKSGTAARKRRDAKAGPSGPC